MDDNIYRFVGFVIILFCCCSSSSSSAFLSIPQSDKPREPSKLDRALGPGKTSANLSNL